MEGSYPVVSVGAKFHIMTRRLFEEDVRRHFAGEVAAVSGNLVELKGYTFVFRMGSNEWHKRPELRTRVYDLGSAGHIVNKIPGTVRIDRLEYKMENERLVLTDGVGYTLDINEFGPSR